MKVLAVDTSSNVASVAIMDEDTLIGEYILNNKKTHSQKLMPIIKEIIENTGLKIDDISLFAGSKGPGSFTGLRIGLATIKSLAHATDKPVIGVSSLEGLAFNIPYCQELIYPIMDARRDRVYNAIYRWQTDTIISKQDHRIITIEDLIKEVKDKGEKVIFCGDGVNIFTKRLKGELGDLCQIAPISHRTQRASSIAALSLQKFKKGQVETYIDLLPLYLRKSQAEREYERSRLLLTNMLTGIDICSIMQSKGDDYIEYL